MFAGICFSCANAFADETALDALKRELGRCWKVFDSKLDPDARAIIAAVPFKDDLGGLRRLGTIACDMAESHISRADRHVLVTRSRLNQLMMEKDLWESDLLAKKNRRRTMKILRADYLVLGQLTPAGETILFSVSLVKADSGKVLASESFTVPNSREMWKLLWYVRRPPKAPSQPVEVPPMRVHFTVLGERREPGGKVERVRVTDGSALSSGDQFQIRFTPASDCWVYIFLKDSTARVSTLFPYAGVRVGNHCRGGVTYSIPDPDPLLGSRWFTLDENRGTETIYLAASYDPVSDLDSVTALMYGARLVDPKEIKDKFNRAVERLRRDAEKSESAPKGIVVREDGDGATPENPQDVLHGRFALVKELRIIHK